MAERSFVRSPTALSRRVRGEVLLATAEREGVEALSETALTVWDLLETPQTRGSLIALMADRYAVSPEGIGGDVQALVAQFLDRGWIEEGGRD
jgi:Coenzyme PQQ synthesis protein D (PqqD)